MSGRDGADAPAARARADEQHDERAPTAKDMMLNGLQAALYMLVVRALAGWYMGWAMEDVEEGAQAGRASAMFVGFVIVFHRFQGPAAIGIPFSVLQVLFLVMYYMAGAAYFYGDNGLFDGDAADVAEV